MKLEIKYLGVDELTPYENNTRKHGKEDPHYCDVIIQRWETFTGKKAEKIN